MSIDGNVAGHEAGEGRIDAVLTQIRLAARGINLYTFERTDGGQLPAAEPGAHIGLHLPNGLNRQYSLVVSDASPTSYTVGVKKDEASRGASRWIHEHLRVGAVVPLDLPRNNFALDEATGGKSILIAGGIGITPLYCMMHRLAALGQEHELHYSSRTRDQAAFLRELSVNPAAYLYFSDEMAGERMPIDRIIAQAPAGTHFYCCGPSSMLEAFEAACAVAGCPAETIHVEYFTPRYETATEGGFDVELKRSGLKLAVPAGKSILQVLLDAGIDVPHSCDMGICGTCETRVLEGTPDHRDSLLSDTERAESKTMMICCSGAKSAKLVLDL